MSKAARTALTGIVAFTLGAVFVLFRPRSEVVELREYQIAETLPPTLCTVHESDHLYNHLRDENLRRAVPDFHVADSQNAMVILHGRNVRIIKFGTGKFELQDFGCERLD